MWLWHCSSKSFWSWLLFSSLCGVCAIICAGRSWQEGLADAEGETKVIKPQNDNEGLG